MQIKYKTSDYFSLFKHIAIGVNFFTWLKILSKFRYKVAFPFLPKAVFITITSLVNLPFQLLEKVLFQRKVKAINVPPPLFILGHPRSGTTYLYHVLSQDPQLVFCTTNDALVPNIMLTFGKVTAFILGAFMPKSRPQDNVKSGPNLPEEEEFGVANMSTVSFMHGFYFPNALLSNFRESVLFEHSDQRAKKEWQEQFAYFIRKLTYKNKGKTLLVKSPANTGRIKEILEVFPDARFIHIHRNPYEVYQSNGKLYENVLPLLSLHKADNAAVEEYLLTSYREMHQKFLAEKALIPVGQFYEMSYADFVTHPVERLEKAYQHLSLEGFEMALPHLKTEIRSSEGYQKNQHSTLNPEVMEKINTQWDFFFEAYGYSIEEPTNA